ncbi:MAG: flagellar basal body L-ring protein FlgH [Herminiimonas sp.]|nr:flagellar basal body L-ring protein FlgH [Herminiimonas sp.]
MNLSAAFQMRSQHGNGPAIKALFAVVACGVLAGCATVPDSIVQKPSAIRPQPVAAAAPANGAIFQTAAYRPMFEDRRARLIGDLLTIVINEKTTAAKQDTGSASKTAGTSFSVPKLLGLPATTTDSLGVNTATSNKFEDKGAASSSNNFSGTMGVTVTDVLPNGNLVVSGEKQIAMDKGIEFIRFSGIVNPDTIATGNLVSSTQVADARVEYRTNTRLDAADVMSQMARFFLSVLPL